MGNAQRGMRIKLGDGADCSRPISVVIKAEGPRVYDFVCFGVDGQNQLSDDRYMVFYNQTVSPQREICMNAGNGSSDFTVDLSSLPQNIQKLVFTVSIDGEGTMSELRQHSVAIVQNSQTIWQADFAGADFAAEKAVISLEIYNKGGIWRASFLAQGFNGGLSDLLKYYGGEEDSSEVSAASQTQAGTAQITPAPSLQASAVKAAFVPAAPVKAAPAPVPEQPRSVVSLEKKLASAPALVSLAKPLGVSLKKHKLEEVKAQVALVIDASGSMSRSYSDGTVQEIINRILPLAVQFDDDGELALWYFAEKPKRMPSVNLKNYTTVVPRNLSTLSINIGCYNKEHEVMRQVAAEFRDSRLPVYVVFISDGGVHFTDEISREMKAASSLPIFWQFVGVRGEDYGILENLDTMTGRVVDNANFFALDDFKTVPSNELYDRMLCEFPSWIKAAKAKKIMQ